MREKDLKSIKEGLGDLAAQAEMDHEIQMARSELYKIAKYAIKLHEMLKGRSEEQGLEAWQQSKITKAADYMGSVYHNLEYEMKFGAQMAEGKKTMSRAAKGHEKYGKDGMAALAKAGREGAGEEKLDKIRDKHDKYDKDVDEAAKKGLYYNVNKRKKAGTSRDADSPKAPTAQAWKDAAKTAKKEEVAEVAGPEKCWPGHRKVGTQPGTGKNAGKRVNKCVKVGEDSYKLNLAQKLDEKSKSKAQQKFMGMVYATKKGEKPASKDVAKVAKGMSKSDAKDFASTKHKGKPEHVKKD